MEGHNLVDTVDCFLACFLAQGHSVVNGHEVDGWKIKGLQSNYWYQTVSSGTPVQLVQEVRVSFL
jgi:hypothetical protein